MIYPGHSKLTDKNDKIDLYQLWVGQRITLTKSPLFSIQGEFSIPKNTLKGETIKNLGVLSLSYRFLFIFFSSSIFFSGCAYMTSPHNTQPSSSDIKNIESKFTGPSDRIDPNTSGEMEAMAPLPPLEEIEAMGSIQKDHSSSFPIIELPLEEEEDEFVPVGPTYDLPIVINDSVEAYIGFFQIRIRDRFENYLNRSGRYLELMKEIFKKKGLPEDLVFVALIESGFNPYAYSRARAAGPWQFIKSTGRNYGLRIDAWIDERRDPVKSTVAAARYLKDLYTMFGSWPLALASYNAGEGRVKRAIGKTKSNDFWDIKATRYLKRETRDYVPKFMAATIIAKNPEHYGFNLDYHDPLKYDEIKVDRPTDLRLVAKTLGVSYKVIKDLNPELRTTITPPHFKSYMIKIPYGTKQTFIKNFSKIPEDQRILAFRHEVQRGQTLWGLARRYGTTISNLKELNNMGRRSHLREGERLLVTLDKNIVGIELSYAKNEKGVQRNVVYRVKRGDSLWKISRKFDVSIKKIKRWNKLTSNRIYPGKRLILKIKSGNL